MKTKRTPPPLYSVNELLKLTRYLPPLLSGDFVRVQAIQSSRSGYRYQVRPDDYDGQPVWAYEEDLVWILAG